MDEPNDKCSGTGAKVAWNPPNASGLAEAGCPACGYRFAHPGAPLSPDLEIPIHPRLRQKILVVDSRRP